MKTLLGCTVVIAAGILLNSGYSEYSILLKTLCIILIVLITKIFEGGAK